MFAFANLDTGKIVGYDASQRQAKNIISTIEEYREDLSEIAFTFKRTGTGTDTTYTLNPIIRLKGEDQSKFDALGEQEVTMEFFENALQPSTDAFLVKLLTDIDPSVKDKLFPEVDISDFLDDNEKANPVENSDESDSALDII